jgi:hypothetical protein
MAEHGYYEVHEKLAERYGRARGSESTKLPPDLKPPRTGREV